VILAVCSVTVAPADARERIILAAERLIAEHGPEVALRDIAMAAGQRNNSAVHYHFGSRDGLIEAVVRRRQRALEVRRLELLAALETTDAPDDVGTLVGILVRPMFEVPYAEGSTHYARCLEQIRSHPTIRETGLSREFSPAVQILTARLARALVHLPPRSRLRRLESMASVMFALLADHERASESTGVTMTDDARAVDDILQMIVGLLTAPVAASTGSA